MATETENEKIIEATGSEDFGDELKNLTRAERAKKVKPQLDAARELAAEQGTGNRFGSVVADKEMLESMQVSDAKEVANDPTFWKMGRGDGFGDGSGFSAMQAGDAGNHPKLKRPFIVRYSDTEPDTLEFGKPASINYEGEQEYWNWRKKIDPETGEVLQEEEYTVEKRPKYDFVMNYNGTIFFSGQWISPDLTTEELDAMSAEYKWKGVLISAEGEPEVYRPLSEVMAELKEQGVTQAGYTTVHSDKNEDAQAFHTVCGSNSNHKRPMTVGDQIKYHEAFDYKDGVTGEITHYPANSLRHKCKSQGAGFTSTPPADIISYNTESTYNPETKQFEGWERGGRKIKLFMASGEQKYANVRGFPCGAAYAKKDDNGRGMPFYMKPWDALLPIKKSIADFMLELVGTHDQEVFFAKEKVWQGVDGREYREVSLDDMRLEVTAADRELYQEMAPNVEFDWETYNETRTPITKEVYTDENQTETKQITIGFKNDGHKRVNVKDTKWNRMYCGGLQEILDKSIEVDTANEQENAGNNPSAHTSVVPGMTPTSIMARAMAYGWLKEQDQSRGSLLNNKKVRNAELVICRGWNDVIQAKKALKADFAEIGKGAVLGFVAPFAMDAPKRTETEPTPEEKTAERKKVAGFSVLGVGAVVALGVIPVVGTAAAATLGGVGAASVAGMANKEGLKAKAKKQAIAGAGGALVAGGLSFALSPVTVMLLCGAAVGAAYGAHRAQYRVLDHFDAHKEEEETASLRYEQAKEFNKNHTVLGMGVRNMQIGRLLDGYSTKFYGKAGGEWMMGNVERRASSKTLQGGLLSAVGIGGAVAASYFSLGAGLAALSLTAGLGAGLPLIAMGSTLRFLKNRGQEASLRYKDEVEDETRPSTFYMRLQEISRRTSKPLEFPSP